MQIKCKINSKEMVLELSPLARVLDVLRERGFTSVKEGCGGGECGACSIFMDGRLVNACLLIALQMDGAEIYTLEGMQEETQEIQQSFIKGGAIQCGFCTSGFVLRAYDYVQKGGRKDEQSIKEAFDGNLCRCTGYQKIVESVKESMQ
jgi:carbon-monoxide dehydrogenase small subunit